MFTFTLIDMWSTTVALWPMGVQSNGRGYVGEWKQPNRAKLSPVIEY